MAGLSKRLAGRHGSGCGAYLFTPGNGRTAACQRWERAATGLAFRLASARRRARAPHRLRRTDMSALRLGISSLLFVAMVAQAADEPSRYAGEDVCTRAMPSRPSRTARRRTRRRSPTRRAPTERGCEACHGAGQAHVDEGGGNGVGDLETFARARRRDRALRRLPPLPRQRIESLHDFKRRRARARRRHLYRLPRSARRRRRGPPERRRRRRSATAATRPCARRSRCPSITRCPRAWSRASTATSRTARRSARCCATAQRADVLPLPRRGRGSVRLRAHRAHTRGLPELPRAARQREPPSAALPAGRAALLSVPRVDAGESRAAELPRLHPLPHRHPRLEHDPAFFLEP